MNTETSASAKCLREMTREPQATVKRIIKPQTKASLVEGMLLRGAGASIADLGEATGWQPHTCRAFLTGLRKKGRRLERARRADGVTIYRLAPIAAVG